MADDVMLANADVEKFATEWKSHILATGRPTRHEKKALRIIDDPNFKRRDKFLSNAYRHAVDFQESEGSVGKIDWSKIDWTKLLENLTKLLAIILPLFGL